MNYQAQLIAEIDGLPNPFIDLALKKLNKYKIPYVINGAELEGRQYIRIEQVDIAPVKKPRQPAKPKPCTGITSTPMDDGRHLYTHPGGRTSICSFAWDEAHYWKIVRETRARIDRRMNLGNYGLDSLGKVGRHLPLKGELFTTSMED